MCLWILYLRIISKVHFTNVVHVKHRAQSCVDLFQYTAHSNKNTQHSPVWTLFDILYILTKTHTESPKDTDTLPLPTESEKPLCQR